MSNQSNFTRRIEHSSTPTFRASAEGGHRPPRIAYTLELGGRRCRIRPAAFWGVAALLAMMATWSAVTATYFAFRDEVLAGLVTRQANMQYAYENRISDMKGEVARLTNKQLLDQEQFEYKLDQIIRRQATLESRATALSNVPDLAGKPPKAPLADGPVGAPVSAPKPSPISDTQSLESLSGRGAWLQPSPSGPAANQAAVFKRASIIESTLRALQASLDRVEGYQGKTLGALAEIYDTRARHMRGVLVDLGMNPAKVPAASATGGPFVPIVAPLANAGTFELQLHRINIARSQLERLHQALVTVPIRKPIPGDLELTSGFGVRLDPFIRAPAMHTGVDLRGNVGDPVRGTAAGTVTQAGFNGGYGKMVEIDHGNGFSTRYGHLSAIDVAEGQTIRIGQVVGRIGMTGRTTGPHLHYETRVDGEAVDPQKFLRAERRLGASL